MVASARHRTVRAVTAAAGFPALLILDYAPYGKCHDRNKDQRYDYRPGIFS